MVSSDAPLADALADEEPTEDLDGDAGVQPSLLLSTNTLRRCIIFIIRISVYTLQISWKIFI
jgi:hypothetical protein